MRNKGLLVKMSIRIEYKVPDGRIAYTEVGIMPEDLIVFTQLQLDQIIDAHVDKIREDNARRKNTTPSQP